MDRGVSGWGELYPNGIWMFGNVFNFATSLTAVLHMHVKPMIKYRICNYVCMQIGHYAYPM